MWQNPIPADRPLWSEEAQTLFSLLQSSQAGLSEIDARKRLQPLKKQNPVLRELKLFLSRFADPMMLLLMVGVLLPAALDKNANALKHWFFKRLQSN